MTTLSDELQSFCEGIEFNEGQWFAAETALLLNFSLELSFNRSSLSAASFSVFSHFSSLTLTRSRSCY